MYTFKKVIYLKKFFFNISKLSKNIIIYDDETNKN